MGDSKRMKRIIIQDPECSRLAKLFSKEEENILLDLEIEFWRSKKTHRYSRKATALTQILRWYLTYYPKSIEGLITAISKKRKDLAMKLRKVFSMLLLSKFERRK